VLLTIIRGVFWFLLAVLVIVGIVLATYRWQASAREVRDARDVAPAGGRFVRAGDVDIHIQETGPANGTAVLFVHGTGAWSETWREAMTQLAAAGFHAVALDLPPFGYSQRPDEPRYSKAEQARRIVGVLDAIGAKQAILVGHSFGGGPTVEAAITAPERVKALVLVDSALSIRADGVAPSPPSKAIRALFGFEPLRDAVVATFLTNPAFTRRLLENFIAIKAAATDERLAIYQRPLVVRASTHAVGNWLPELVAPGAASRSEDPAAYASLTMPVVAIWGERDTITPLPQGERVVRLLPRARLEVLKDVGHIPQIEGPDAFNELLLRVVKDLDG